MNKVKLLNDINDYRNNPKLILCKDITCFVIISSAICFLYISYVLYIYSIELSKNLTIS